MANYGQMSMNNIGVNMNTIGMTVNNTTNNNTNGVQVNGLNNIAIPARVNVINNSLAVGNTAVRNVNGNYGMVNIANQNIANLQLRNGLNTTAAVGANRIVGATGLTYANANPVIQQRVATASQISAANIQTSNIYNQYQFNPNLINVGKKNVANLSPINNATTSLGNVGQRLVQTYSATNLQNPQFTKPIQVNSVSPQNIQLINQSAVIAKTTLNQSQVQQPQVQQPQVQQQKNVITTPVLSTSTTTNLNDPNKVKQEIVAGNITPASHEKITVNKNVENLNQTKVQGIKSESATTPVATVNSAITTLTPNSEGINEASKINNLNETTVKMEKNELNNTVKTTLSTPLSEAEETKKTQLSGSTTQSQSTNIVTSTNNTFQVASGVQNKSTNGTTITTNNVSYNQGQNMYQKQFINNPTAVNYPQTAVASNFQINKSYFPTGTTNQTAYLNQVAIKQYNGNTVGIQQPKYYTVANGTYSNVNGTVQTGIKTINSTGPVSYTVANNQKYVITNPATNNIITNNNKVQGVNQYSTVNNTMTNVYQVANNNAVKVNGYIPNNGQVVMNTVNNGQVSYVKVNPTVNGNVISNGSNIVNYSTNSTTMINGTAPYVNKTGLPNSRLMTTTVNANGAFAKPLTTGQGEPNSKYLMSSQMSSFLLTPPAVTSTTSSRRRNEILRPPNPFILYRQEHHSKVLAEHEGISNTEISKIIGKMWKEESEEVKNKYKEKAQEMKRRHKLMYPDYRFSPRKQEEIRRRKKRKNVNPAPEATKDENKKDENKTENKTTEENIENAKKKLKTETSTVDTTKATNTKSDTTVTAVSTNTTNTTINVASSTNANPIREIKKEGNLDFLNDLSANSSLSVESINSVLNMGSTSSNPNVKTETTTANIPSTTENSSNNIITSNSLFNDIDTSLSNINSFDIENFDITEDNNFIDNYLNFNSNHTFQTTSDSMFNQLTDLINNNKK